MTRSLMRRTASMVVVAAVGLLALLGLSSPAWAGGDHSHTHEHGDGGHSHSHSHGGVHFLLQITGGHALSSTDKTPTISGLISPTDGIAALDITVSVRGRGIGTVACTGLSVSDAGAWSCTVARPLTPGTYRLDVRAKATYEDGAHGTAHAKATLQITGTTPEPKPTEEPKPSPTPKPSESPEPSPTPEPSATADPSIDEPDPVPTPKPTPRHYPATPSGGSPTVTPVADKQLKRLAWSFHVVDENGKDITGSPVRMGDHVTIVSDGLPAGAKVALEIHSTPTSLGAATAGADGHLVLAIAVPATIAAGSHTLVATLTAPGYAPSVASVRVRVNEALELSGELDAGPLPPAPDIEPVTPDIPPDVDSRGFNDKHTGIADGLQTIHDIDIEPWKFAATGSLAAALVLLAALPAELLQSTLSENYGRAFGWLEPARRRVAGVRARGQRRFRVNPWVGSSFTVAVAAFILGFAQPSYGFNAESLKEFVALFLSLFMLNIVVNAVRLGVAWNKLRLPGYLMPMPGALVVAAVSVIVSRWLSLNPALLFGLVIGVHFAHIHSKKVAGKLALVAVTSVLALGVVSWVGFSLLVQASGDSDGLFIEVLEETLAATALESLSVLLVALLPFQFLEGKHLHDWDQRVWAGMYLVAASAFVFIAVPLGDTWEDAREPLATWLSLLAGFTLISLAAWALFRFIPTSEHVAEHEKAAH